MQSARLLIDGCHNFRVILLEATESNTTQIAAFVERPGRILVTNHPFMATKWRMTPLAL